MSELFTPKTKEEFLASVDRGIAQAKNGQRQDAHEAMDEITRELEAGFFSLRLRVKRQPVHIRTASDPFRIFDQINDSYVYNPVTLPQISPDEICRLFPSGFRPVP